MKKMQKICNQKYVLNIANAKYIFFQKLKNGYKWNLFRNGGRITNTAVLSHRRYTWFLHWSLHDYGQEKKIMQLFNGKLRQSSLCTCREIFVRPTFATRIMKKRQRAGAINEHRCMAERTSRDRAVERPHWLLTFMANFCYSHNAKAFVMKRDILFRDMQLS